MPLAGLLIERSGWQAPFLILAIMGSLSFLLLLWMLPKDPPHPDGRPSLFKNLKAVLTSTLALTGLSLGLLFYSANETINLVFGVWLEDSFGLEIALLGAVSLVIGLAELGGESLVALFTDRLGKPRAIAIGLAGNCLALIILILLGHKITGAVLSLFLFFLSFEFTIVSALPLMSELMPARRATLMSTNMAFISLGRALGAALATPLYVSLGIWANAILAIFFNVLGLVVLVKLTRGMGKRG